jgi:hypothetical protein
MGSMITVSWQVFHGHYDISWKLGYRKLVEDIIDWFLTKFDLHDPSHSIKINLSNYDKLQCWGETFQVDDLDLNRREYVISIATDQGLRDFIATLMHELVHLHQWERDEWEGDGEKEAEDKQYGLADEYWKEGLIR